MDKGAKIQTIDKNSTENMRELYEVYRKTILDNYPEYSSSTREYLARIDIVEQMIKNAGLILCAYIDGRLVGYLIARKVWGVLGIVRFWEFLMSSKEKGSGQNF